MRDGPLSGEEDATAAEDEGVAAFLRLSRAIEHLGPRLGEHAHALAASADLARRAASDASNAAATAASAAHDAHEASLARARHSFAWAAGAALLVALLAGVTGFRYGHAGGFAAGEAEAYARARDERAAASWANTPAGLRALALDAAGSLSRLHACDAPGWRIEAARDGRRLCSPRALPDGSLHGWYVSR